MMGFAHSMPEIGDLTAPFVHIAFHSCSTQAKKSRHASAGSDHIQLGLGHSVTGPNPTLIPVSVGAGACVIWSLERFEADWRSGKWSTQRFPRRPLGLCPPACV